MGVRGAAEGGMSPSRGCDQWMMIVTHLPLMQTVIDVAASACWTGSANAAETASRSPKTPEVILFLSTLTVLVH